MTRELTLRTVDLPTIHRFGIGFENIFDELMRVNHNQTKINYPPYNIIRTDDNNFTIELAVAGFQDSEIDIILKNGELAISGSQEQSTDNNENLDYLYKGISNRAFTRSFRLAEHVEVLGASLANGILSISLERIIPESEKPRKIDITLSK